MKPKNNELEAIKEYIIYERNIDNDILMKNQDKLNSW